MFPLTTLILSLYEDSDAIQDCISTSQTCEEEDFKGFTISIMSFLTSPHNFEPKL
jgi:hypothetical protein